MTRSPLPSSVSRPIKTRLLPAAYGSVPSPCTHTTRVCAPVKPYTAADDPRRAGAGAAAARAGLGAEDALVSTPAKAAGPAASRHAPHDKHNTTRASLENSDMAEFSSGRGRTISVSEAVQSISSLEPHECAR